MGLKKCSSEGVISLGNQYILNPISLEGRIFIKSISSAKMDAKTMVEKEGSVSVKGSDSDHVECGNDVTGSDHLEASRVLRKVDCRLLPVLALLYLLAFLDRGNLGNAKVR